MARDQVVIECPQDDWVQLTNGDVTAITFQVRKNYAEIRFTTDATSPGADDKGLIYTATEGEANKSLSDLVNLASAARVWARGFGGPAEVYVDHA